jgi:arginyl-tRNA synthetase
MKIEVVPIGIDGMGYVFKGAELELLRMLADWPRIIELASASREPHRIVFYLNELASEFHSLWNKGNNSSNERFIVEEDRVATNARLTLLGGVRAVLVSGLQGIVGVLPQAEMR